MDATVERVTAEQPSRVFFGVTPLAWAILGTVAGVPADCMVTGGLVDGSLVATCDDGGDLIYDPYSGQWLA